MRSTIRGLWHLTVVGTILGVALCAAPGSANALGHFLRGDVDGNRVVNLADAVGVLRHLFLGFLDPEGSPLTCLDAVDADDSGHIDITDAVYLLNHMFMGGKRPPPPSVGCGMDTTRDSLTCDSYEGCHRDLLDLVDGQEAIVLVVEVSDHTALAVRHAVDMICAVRAEVELGLILYDQWSLKFPQAGLLLPAGPDQKLALRDFLYGLRGSHLGFCPQAALLDGFSMLQQSFKGDRTIILIGLGMGLCPGTDEDFYLQSTLSEIKAANTDGVVIHSALTGPTSEKSYRFLEDLTSQNGGTIIELSP